VRVLQWQETSGWLEFWDQDNQDITELPSWVALLFAVWQVADDLAKTHYTSYSRTK
jgi:hypothetical protein